MVRIFNTYGPNMALDDGRVVSNFVAQALTGQPLTIFGDGQQTRSFQYVSDLIEGEPDPFLVRRSSNSSCLSPGCRWRRLALRLSWCCRAVQRVAGC